FTRVGIVSLDRNGKVVAAVPADRLADRRTSPRLAPVQADGAVASPSKLSCHVAAVQLIPAVGQTAAHLKTKVTLKNSGTQRFELKHDAASTLRRFLLIEVYDAQGALLFRDDEMRYHSPGSPDPARWPVLAIPAGQEIAAELSFSPAHGFGPLPTGTY